MSPTELNPTRLDQLYQYALAIAAQAEDFKQRDLGPIHLLKYAYLADLAHAERHDGATYSGVSWQFHNFGPWSVEAFARVSPSVTNIGAARRAFGSSYADDAVRYHLDATDAERLARQLETSLPYEITSAISRALHQHGTDTADLLRHVYVTAPMLNAKPGSMLDLGAAVCRETAPTYEVEAPTDLTRKEKKTRKAALDSAREEIQRRLRARAATRTVLSPAPRYDEVFYEGTAALDRAAGEPLVASSGELQFDESVWLSAQRRDPEVS